MDFVAMVRQRFGPDPDPLADVPPEHANEAERIVALWSEVGRSELRSLPRLANPAAMPGWKFDLFGRLLARLVLRSTGRRQLAAVQALRAFCADLDPLQALNRE